MGLKKSDCPMRSIRSFAFPSSFTCAAASRDRTPRWSVEDEQMERGVTDESFHACPVSIGLCARMP